MSEHRRRFTAPRVAGRGRAAMLCALGLSMAVGGFGASASTADIGDDDLRRAPVWSHRGSAAPTAKGRIRVRVILDSQPLMVAAVSPRSRAAVRPGIGAGVRLAAQRHPDRISRVEEAASLRAEHRYKAAIADLADEAGEADRELDRVESQAIRLGGRVVDCELVPAALVVRIGAGRLSQLAGLGSVQAIDLAPKPLPLSGIGAQAAGAPAWWSAGFTGGTGPSDTVAADVALQSEAADPTHPAFSDVSVDNDPGADVTDHGTHTGGIIASGDMTYRGVAYGVDRLIGSANEAYALGFILDSSPGADDPAETINLSFGSSAMTDDADDGDDVLTAVFGVGQAQGAGNDNVDGSPSVANIGRNVLSVGAYNDVGTVASTDDVVLGVSSRGPTPGGRKKPDLTAPGGAVIAPSALWNSPPSNPDFTGASGTSFSAPHVAGAMTLLEGAGVSDPMAQRAILINSARDWDGTATGLDGWTPTQASWQPEVGWGELDLGSALAERGNYLLGEVRGGEAAFYRATVPTGAKSTLAFEMRGYFVGFPNPGTQTIKYTQSNLNLRQYLSDGTEITPPSDPGHGGGPDAVDPNDTVEQVRAPAGGPQEITYKVEAASTIEGAETEPFAITAAAPLTALDSPHVRPVELDTDATSVRCGEPVEVKSSLRNDSGDLVANEAGVTLEVPGGVELIAGSAIQEVSGGDLEQDITSETHSWTVRATTDGPKVMSVVGRGSGLGTPFTRVEEVSFTADCVAPATAIVAGPDGRTRDSTPTFSFSSEPGSAFECAVDGLGFQPCADPRTLVDLSDGGHTFAVRAIDVVGNIDPSPATSSFTVDTRVSGARTKLLSRRIVRRKRSLGSVLAEMGESGRVAITGRVRIGRRSKALPLRERGIGEESVAIPLRVPGRQFKAVRRAERRGKHIRVDARVRFSDDLGNREKRTLSYTLRR